MKLTGVVLLLFVLCRPVWTCAAERKVLCELPAQATKCIVQEQAWTGTIWRDKVTATPADGQPLEMTVPCATTKKAYRLCVEGTSGKAGRLCQDFGYWCRP